MLANRCTAVLSYTLHTLLPIRLITSMLIFTTAHCFVPQHDFWLLCTILLPTLSCLSCCLLAHNLRTDGRVYSELTSEEAQHRVNIAVKEVTCIGVVHRHHLWEIYDGDSFLVVD